MKTAKCDMYDIFADSSQFPLVIFNIDEMGPGVLYRDFTELPDADIDPDSIDTFLMNLAISYISAIGQGHSYIEGVFDLPAGKLENYRLILISFYIGSEYVKDDYDFCNYYQIGMFIPKPLNHLLPAISSFETFILKYVKKNFEGSFSLTNDKINQIKQEIIASLTFVIFEKMKRCAC